MTLIQMAESELCKVCDVSILWDDINFRNRSGVAICDDCHSNHYYYCDYCENSVGTPYWNHETDMCELCTSVRFSRCADCDNLVNEDNLYYSDYSSDVRCEYCYYEHENESHHIPNVQGYHSGAPWSMQYHTIGGHSDSPLGFTYYGVELECEDVSADIGDVLSDMMSARIGHAETDGSLNNGIEFITQPATLMAWRDSFGDSVREYMSKVQQFGGTFEDDTCGAHVHVSRTAFDNDTHLFRFVTFMRHNESFVRVISGRDDSSIDQWAKVNNYRSGELRQEVKRQSGNRYRAVNLSNSRTVEVRAFAGSNDFADIIGSIELISAVIEYVRDLTISDVNIGALFADSFITWLMDAELCDYDNARNLVVKRYGTIN